MGYSSMSHTSWWSAQNDKNEIHALITKNSEWSHKIDKIYPACISVAYDQTHDHQCLTSIVSQPKANKDWKTTK